MIKKRRVMFISGSRGEYGYIRPILKKLLLTKELDYAVVATNMLLIPEFGYAVNNFLQDGLEVRYKIDMSLAAYSNESMVKSLGIFLSSLTDVVSNDRPDMILLAGDRGEQMVGAMVGAHMNIPVAHIQAGELSGNIDGMTRHAITKYAHIHFASNQDAYQRLLKMGEQDFRVFNTGAPQLDEFLQYPYLSKDEFYNQYNLDAARPVVLLVQHPVTEESARAEEQIQVTLAALFRFPDFQIMAILPNNDAGSNAIQKTILASRSVCRHIFKNLGREEYANIMRNADFMIGNSSSGILEAPTFHLPAVNIGRRQHGRFQAGNVINTGHSESEITAAVEAALSPALREKLQKEPNPYGDGKSSERIIEILANIEIDSKLVYKELTY